MALGVIPSGFPPNKKKEHFLAIIRRGSPPFLVQGGSAAGRVGNSQDTPPGDSKPEATRIKSVLSLRGLRAATAPTPASWSLAGMRIQARPGSLAEARRCYGAARSAGWMHHARRAGSAIKATAVVLKSVVERRPRGRAKRYCRTCRSCSSLARNRGDGHSNLCGLRDRERRFTGWSAQIVNYPIGE